MESFGVEKQEFPSIYAKIMQFNFEERTSWFGIEHGKVLPAQHLPPHDSPSTQYDIQHGDFLDEEWRERISKADIIFVNNFAFGTQLNQELKVRFSCVSNSYAHLGPIRLLQGRC